MKKYEKPNVSVFLYEEEVETLFKKSNEQYDNEENDLDDWGIKL